MKRTPFYPRSPYGVAKLYAYWIIVNYREAYDIFACNGILFNHESPIRGETFVTRKITRAAAKIALNLQAKMHVGNLDAKRDWGHAKDYIEAMWLMLQQPSPQDYVIATGQTTSVREFTTKAFSKVGIELSFSGSDENEVGRIAALHGDLDHLTIGQELVAVDPKYYRPTEVDLLIGDASKAKNELSWQPKYDIDKLVNEMVISDLNLFKRDQALMAAGFKPQKNGFD